MYDVIKAKEAFIEAESFLSASIYIISQDDAAPFKDCGKYMAVNVASEINHSFSVELYLKCLLIITNGSHNTGHDLGGLFEKLKLEIKEKINRQYKEVYMKDEPRLTDVTEYTAQELLCQAGDYFKKARYYFERGKEKKYRRYSLYFVVKAIRDIIFEYSPELKNISFAN